MKKSLTTIVFGLILATNLLAAEPEVPADVLQAARAGDPEAQVEMGILYEYGFRMKDNKISALAWYIQASEHGNSRATLYRDRLTGKLSATEVARARKIAETLESGAK